MSEHDRAVNDLDEADGTSTAGAAGPEPKGSVAQGQSQAQSQRPVQTGPVTHRADGPEEPVWPVGPEVASKQDPQALKLVRTAWRWAAVSVLLFPILAIWALPSAASVAQRLSAGDVDAARGHAGTSRALGVASIVAAIVLLIFWVILVATLEIPVQ